MIKNVITKYLENGVSQYVKNGEIVRNRVCRESEQNMLYGTEDIRKGDRDSG